MLAGSVAAEINTHRTDPATTLPVNQVVAASASGNVIAIAGPDPSGASGFIHCLLKSRLLPTETYNAGSQLPRGPAADIAGRWSGYITAPQDGFYDIT